MSTHLARARLATVALTAIAMVVVVLLVGPERRHATVLALVALAAVSGGLLVGFRRRSAPAGRRRSRAGDATLALRSAEEGRREAERLFATAFDEAPRGMAIVGLDGRWLKVNAEICRFTGYTEDELLRRSFQEITHPDDLAKDLGHLDALLAGRIPGYAMEKRYLTAEGEWRWGLLSVSLVRDRTGQPEHFISHIEDITERKAMDADLRRAHEYATTIISAMAEGYLLTVGDTITEVNDALCRLTGFSAQELVGARAPFPFWVPDQAYKTLKLRELVLAQGGGTFDVTLRRQDHSRFEAEITVCSAQLSDGTSVGQVHTVRDISERRRYELELNRLARTDTLTTLPNRYALEEALASETARSRRQDRPLSLVLLDLDRFKQVNDRHGHPVGDRALVEVARRLERLVRAGETIARMGGEEFAWLLPGADLDQALVAAERGRHAVLAAPFSDVGYLTLSAGVCELGQAGGPSHMYELADRALYHAKRRGRNRVERAAAADERIAVLPPR